MYVNTLFFMANEAQTNITILGRRQDSYSGEKALEEMITSGECDG
jgi:hypothetical protein